MDSLLWTTFHKGAGFHINSEDCLETFEVIYENLIEEAKKLTFDGKPVVFDWQFGRGATVGMIYPQKHGGEIDSWIPSLQLIQKAFQIEDGIVPFVTSSSTPSGLESGAILIDGQFIAVITIKPRLVEERYYPRNGTISNVKEKSYELY